MFKYKKSKYKNNKYKKYCNEQEKKQKLKFVIPTEIYFTESEELSLKESLKNLKNQDQILRNFAITNIVECFENANKRKDISWSIKQNGNSNKIHGK